MQKQSDMMLKSLYPFMHRSLFYKYFLICDKNVFIHFSDNFGNVEKFQKMGLSLISKQAKLELTVKL
jgi:hypothetical protein